MILQFYSTNGQLVESRECDTLHLTDIAYSMSGGSRVLMFAPPEVVAEHQMLADVATLRVDELTLDPVATLRHILTKKVILCSIDMANSFMMIELAKMWKELTGSDYYAMTTVR